MKLLDSPPNEWSLAEESRENTPSPSVYARGGGAERTFAIVVVVYKGSQESQREACEKLQEDARQIAVKAGVEVVTHVVEGHDIEFITKAIPEIGAGLQVIDTPEAQSHVSSAPTAPPMVSLKARHVAC